MSTTQIQQDLERSLLDASLSTDAKEYIANKFWDSNFAQSSHFYCDTAFSAYWDYYAKQCRLALHDNGRHASVRTHGDILDIAKYLKSNCSRQEIRQYLSTLR